MKRYTLTIDTEANIEDIKNKFKFDFKTKIISIDVIKKKRTNQQNRSLYLFFRLLSEALNEAGFDMKAIIKNNVDIEWTPLSIKQYLWKPLQKAMLGSDSTTKLKTGDIDLIFDNLNKIILERTAGEVSILFPSIDSLRENNYEN